MPKVQKKPDCFDIDKYKETNKLTPQMWALEFEHRMKLRQFEKFHLDSIHNLLDSPLISSSPRPSRYKTIDEELAAMRSGVPITDHNIPGLEGKSVIIDYDKPSALGELDDGNPVIRPAKYLDVIFNLEDDEWISEDIYYDLIDDHPKRNAYKTLGFLVFDYSYSNAQLKSSLETVANRYRDYFGIPKPTKHVTESKVRLFHQHKILAVLDLKLWGDAYGVKFSQGNIAEIVFPERNYDDSNYRKTIKPLEKLATDFGYINILKRYDLLE